MSSRYIIGIETSCDDTSIGIVRDDMTVVSQFTVSQTTVHKLFGGVIPEIAARNHIAWIIPVLNSTLKKSMLDIDDISAIAVTNYPGLIGSLLVGVAAAKGLSIGWKKPLIGVNHLHAHIASSFIGKEKKPSLPYLALVVSGGHTSIIEVNEKGWEILGETIDDAAGEAYDKIAKMANLGFPGGPVIDKAAQNGDPLKYDLPYLLKHPRYSEEIVFSFSGIKSAVKRILDEQEVDIASLMATFQNRVMELIERKMKLALSLKNYKAIVISGGVSANSKLREIAVGLSSASGTELFLPDLQYCQDNGAMVAAAAFEDFESGRFSDICLDAAPTLRAVK